MTRPELGTKRTCGDCDAVFYDLNRSPAVCPKCGYTFAEKKASTVAANPAKKAAKPAEPVKPVEPADPPEPTAKEKEDSGDQDNQDEDSSLADNVEATKDEDELDAPADKDSFIDPEDSDEDNLTDLVEGVGDKIKEN
ncbi:MAG: TIGR02300 family protein [Alphaproteobacteria bacterium]